MNARPEFKLLLCLGRVELDQSNSERARQLLSEGIDWAYFLDLAWRHGLMPLVNSHLIHTLASAVPDLHLSKIRDDFRHNVARNVLFTTELCRILNALENERISAVPFKGPALAVQVYGHLNLRSFVDLDIIVRSQDVRRAGEALISLGYEPHLKLTAAQEAMLSRSECDRVYRCERHKFVCELHWAVAPPFFSVPLGAEEIFSNLTTIEFCGGKVKTPSYEILLLLLCVNGTKDLWQSLEPLCAVNELIRTRPALGWESVVGLARAARAERMLLIGLQLARALLGTQLPAMIQDKIAADARAGELAEEVASRMAVDEDREPTLTEKTRFRLRAREHWQDKIRYGVLKLFTPTYKDCTANLPSSLTFAYYGVRVLRLLRAGLKRPLGGAVL